MNIDSIQNGVVIDHITAGCGMKLYDLLGLDKLDWCVALITNAKSAKMGKKDILKVECDINKLDLDILGFIFSNRNQFIYFHNYLTYIRS